MSGFLLGVPGKLKALLDRLTVQRAAGLDNLDNLDAPVSSRLAAAGYTAPDNASIAGIVAYVDELETRLTAARAAKLDSITETRLAQLDTVLATGIKSIQRGTISISGTATSATATITAVNTLKSELRWLGFTTDFSGSDPRQTFPRITLTNSTTITATRTLAVDAPNTIIPWELTEKY